MDRLDALGRCGSLLSDEQLQRVQGRGDVAGEDFQKLKIGGGESSRLRALHVEGADHLLVEQERHSHRTLRPFATLKIQRVFRSVIARIATASRRDVAGHAVVVGLGVQHPSLCFGLHPLGQEFVEPAGLLVEQANLHDIELEEVLGVMDDVALEQLDPLINRHVGEFVWREVGEPFPCRVDGRPLLLLQHRVGDIPHRHDCSHGLPGIGRHREGNGGLDVEVSVVAGPQRGGRWLAVAEQFLKGGHFLRR